MKLIRAMACLFAAAAPAGAGVVQGVVLEQASGRPMSRTQVRLTPIPKSGGMPLAVRTGLQGEYSFLSVPEGFYILTASRPHYFPSSYGQRLPQGRGTPLEIKEDGKAYVELHLRRMGAITGHILDENGIGLFDIPVIAYRARLPLRISATGVSDDRGIYRMHGLLPGKYWVRTGAHTLDDGTTMLPTFSPEAREAHESRAYIVAVDSETTDADIRPMPGALFHLGGIIQCEPFGAPVSVRLTSETGSRTASARCGDKYTFDHLAPAAYEILAETLDHQAAGFVQLFLDRDSESGSVRAGRPPQVDARANAAVKLLGRRQDPTDSGVETELKLPATMLPGNWEMSARTGPNDYVETISGYSGSRRPWSQERSSAGFEVFIGNFSFSQSLEVTVLNTAGHIAGTVLTEQAPVAGIPVFLWPLAETARRSLSGFLQVQTDVGGTFRFDGLPPGDYRLVASFDLTEVDEELMEAAKAMLVHVDKSATAAANLAPWLAP